jgi:hypothetical protein
MSDIKENTGRLDRRMAVSVGAVYGFGEWGEEGWEKRHPSSSDSKVMMTCPDTG